MLNKKVYIYRTKLTVLNCLSLSSHTIWGHYACVWRYVFFNCVWIAATSLTTHIKPCHAPLSWSFNLCVWDDWYWSTIACNMYLLYIITGLYNDNLKDISMGVVPMGTHGYRKKESSQFALFLPFKNHYTQPKGRLAHNLPMTQHIAYNCIRQRLCNEVNTSAHPTGAHTSGLEDHHLDLHWVIRSGSMDAGTNSSAFTCTVWSCFQYTAQCFLPVFFFTLSTCAHTVYLFWYVVWKHWRSKCLFGLMIW